MLSNIEKPVCRAAQDDVGAARQTGFSLPRQIRDGDILLALIRNPLIRLAFNQSLDRSIVSGLRAKRLESSERWPAGDPSVTIVGQLFR